MTRCCFQCHRLVGSGRHWHLSTEGDQSWAGLGTVIWSTTNLETNDNQTLHYRTARLLSLSPRSWDTSRWWRPWRWWRTPWWPPPPPPPWRRSTSSWPPSLCRRRSCPTLRMKAVSEGSLHWVHGPTYGYGNFHFLDFSSPSLISNEKQA